MNQSQESAELVVTPPHSLVKYEAPIYAGEEMSKPEDAVALPRKEGIPKLEDVLNAMLPPREWLEESGCWMQYVSKESASRLDVVILQEKLDKVLAERKARETGICPVREELYRQCYEELIRQVTLDGPERGLLLLRAKDEMRMTIDAYRTLYDASVAFGLQKQLKAEEGIPELMKSVEDSEEEKAALELELANLRTTLEIQEKRDAERRTAEEKRMKEELDFLKYQGQHLDSFLKQINQKK
jgi:dynein light intermediate chain